MTTINKEYVDQLIADFLSPEQDALYGVVQYALFSGGKRLRPILLLKTAAAVSGINDNSRRLAAAIEFIHTYSLVHDDLPCMDNDDFRRGKPTCHKQFGQANAVLSGDALLNLAAETVLGGDMEQKYIVACQYLFNKSGMQGMIHGQVTDIAQSATTFEEMYNVALHKTAALISAAICCGAIVSGAKDSELAIFQKISEKVGIAYQIADDILDSDNTDEVSFLSILGKQRCVQLCKQYCEEIFSLCDLLPYDLSFIKDIAQNNISRKF